MHLLEYVKTGRFSSTCAFSLVKCSAQNPRPYPILSHRWGANGDEVTFRDIVYETVEKRAMGYKKLEFCEKQAALDGLTYFWVDTCCIDKTSSHDLTVVINSMYKWYENAAKYYVYLSDISIEHGQGQGQKQEHKYYLIRDRSRL